MDRLEPIAGSPPDLLNIPKGCPFHPRCPYATEICTTDVPTFDAVNETHSTACHHWQEVQVEL